MAVRDFSDLYDQDILDSIEIPIKRTMWEKICNKIFPDPWAAEERAALIRIAKRIEYKNQLFEERRSRKKKKEDWFVTKAIWKAPFRLNLPEKSSSERYPPKKSYQDVYGKVILSENRRKRKIHLLSINKKDGSLVEDCNTYEPKYFEASWRFLSSQDFFLTHLKPWLDRTLDIEDLRKLDSPNLIIV